MRREEREFANTYRALNQGTQVNAMVAYREFKKQNNPYTRSYVNDTIEGVAENGKWRNYYED